MRIVGGAWGGRRIVAPPGRETRPTTDRVREAWMSAVAPRLPDATVLDLFAGSGALGLEALSRGARHVTFVENSSSALRILEQNLEGLGVERQSFRVLRSDALRYAEGLGRDQFDLAFADPPYGSAAAVTLAQLYAKIPFAKLLCVEHSRDQPIDSDLVFRERRYGDTLLTFLTAESDDDG
jgi:16S rRNA (guanine966-N2)-methyltransferase